MDRDQGIGRVRGKDLVQGVAAWGLSLAAGLLPRAVVARLGVGVGVLLWRALKTRRAVATENLRRAFPDNSDADVHALVREHFEHIGQNALELLTFHRWRRWYAPRVRVEGREHVDALVRQGVGIVMFVPHTGNWEILAPLWPSVQPNAVVLAHPLANRLIERLVDRRRRVTGMQILQRQGGLRALLTALRSGRTVGLLADQDAGPGGVFVPFFGRLASCEPSPAALARHVNCPIVICAAFRETDGSHRVILEVVPRVVGSSNAESDAETLAHIYARVESMIREYPAQWLWMHRRWKTRPPA